jgi:fructosamine-3-kinase
MQLGARFAKLLPAEKPTLVHGDLWSGNVYASDQACLVDPAVYYGHRELDIALSQLFGGFNSVFYQAYNEVYPLQNGWEERAGLYNLYPLLFHLNAFGSSYYGRVMDVVKQFG